MDGSASSFLPSPGTNGLMLWSPLNLIQIFHFSVPTPHPFFHTELQIQWADHDKQCFSRCRAESHHHRRWFSGSVRGRIPGRSTGPYTINSPFDPIGQRGTGDCRSGCTLVRPWRQRSDIEWINSCSHTSHPKLCCGTGHRQPSDPVVDAGRTLSQDLMAEMTGQQ